MVRLVVEREVSFGPCRGKLAEAWENVAAAALRMSCRASGEVGP